MGGQRVDRLGRVLAPPSTPPLSQLIGRGCCPIDRAVSRAPPLSPPSLFLSQYVAKSEFKVEHIQ